MLKLKLQYFVHLKSQLIGKDPDAGKDWGQEEKGMTEDEMVGWHHRLNGREFEHTPADGEEQEVWCAAVHGVPKIWTQLSNKWLIPVEVWQKPPNTVKQLSSN